jgi:hypothetical protein
MTRTDNTEMKLLIATIPMCPECGEKLSDIMPMGRAGDYRECICGCRVSPNREDWGYYAPEPNEMAAEIAREMEVTQNKNVGRVLLSTEVKHYAARVRAIAAPDEIERLRAVAKFEADAKERARDERESLRREVKQLREGIVETAAQCAHSSGVWRESKQTALSDVVAGIGDDLLKLLRVRDDQNE